MTRVLHVSHAPPEERVIYMMEVEVRGGGHRRVWPPGIGKLDEPAVASADALAGWFKRLKITHVVSTFDNLETDESCIADGRYTVAQYLAWWRLAEVDE